MGWWIFGKKTGDELKNKELGGVEHLRSLIKGEAGDIKVIDNVLKSIEEKINANDFENAARLVELSLVPHLKRKKALRQVELIDFRKLGKTATFKGLKRHLRQIR